MSRKRTKSGDGQEIRKLAKPEGEAMREALGQRLPASKGPNPKSPEAKLATPPQPFVHLIWDEGQNRDIDARLLHVVLDDRQRFGDRKKKTTDEQFCDAWNRPDLEGKPKRDRAEILAREGFGPSREALEKRARRMAKRGFTMPGAA